MNILNYSKLIWILTTAIYATFYMITMNVYGRYLLMVMWGVLFVIITLNSHGKLSLKFDFFHMYMVIIPIFCFFSSLYSLTPIKSIIQGTTIFQIYICVALIYLYYRNYNSITPLLKSIMWGGYIVILYIISSYGISNIEMMLSGNMRMSNDFLNSNSLGLLAATSGIIGFHFFLKNKRIELSSLGIPVAVIMVAFSGSRKALLVLFLGSLLLGIIDIQKKSKNILKTWIKILVIIFIISILGYLLLQHPWFDMIRMRMEGLLSMLAGEGDADNSVLLRKKYTFIALDAFTESPILGWGMGASGAILEKYVGWNTYFHNNFVELLASGGILGFIIYYSLHCYLFYNLFKYRKYKDLDYPICIILLFLMTIMDIAMVSYYEKGTYFKLMIFYLYVQILKRRAKGYE